MTQFINGRLEEVLFPRRGITMSHLVKVSHKSLNKRQAAKHLGISERQFSQVLIDKGIGALFRHTKPGRVTLTEEVVRQVASKKADMMAASIAAGYDYSYFKKKVGEYKLKHLFLNSGEAAALSRRGYA